jgi:hypothetical protein
MLGMGVGEIWVAYIIGAKRQREKGTPPEGVRNESQERTWMRETVGLEWPKFGRDSV